MDLGKDYSNNSLGSTLVLAIYYVGYAEAKNGIANIVSSDGKLMIFDLIIRKLVEYSNIIVF